MWNGNAGYPSGAENVRRGPPPVLAAQPTPLEVVRSLEMRRRGRLVGIVAIGVTIPILVLIPSTFFPSFDEASFIALVAALVGSVAAYFLNRMGLVTAASMTLVGGIALAIG